MTCRAVKGPAMIAATEPPIRQYTAERYGNPAMGAAILDGARCSIRFAPERDRMTCAGYADGPVGFELFRARYSPPTMLVIDDHRPVASRSEEHTSELQSLMRISYAVFSLKTKKLNNHIKRTLSQE